MSAAQLSRRFWLLTFALLPFAIAPPFGWVQWAHGRLIVCVALIGILAAMFWRSWMRKRIARRREEEAESPYEALKRELFTIERELTIKGASGIAIAICFAALFVALAWGAVWTGDVNVVLSAIVSGVLAWIGLVAALPVVGRPILVLSRRGVLPAGYGLLPWAEIGGISLTEPERGRAGISCVLRLDVPDLKRHLANAHPLIKAFPALRRGARRRNAIEIPLRRTSEPPVIIHQLCQDLWQADIERARRWRSHLAERMEEKPEAYLAQIEAEMTEMKASDDALVTELKRSAFRSRWLLNAIIPAVAYQFCKPLTNLVPSDAWIELAFGTALAIFLTGGFLFVRDARRALGDLRGRKLLGVMFGLIAGAAIALPFIWFTLQDTVGDAASRTYGARQEITVTAFKKDAFRRRGCDQRLEGVAIGDPICISRQQYYALPGEVPVTLTVRQSWFGYHVDDHQLSSGKW